MLPFLNGIFSFAIWDHEKNFIFIARDALGVKPLYYSECLKVLSLVVKLNVCYHSFNKSSKLIILV